MTSSEAGAGDCVVTDVEPMFRRGILSLPEAARQAHRSPASFRRLARLGRLPFRVQADRVCWLVDGGSFSDWLALPEQQDHIKDTEVHSW